jgi:hypothetical protein
MKFRVPKDEDSENAMKSYKLLLNLIEHNPNLEINAWIDATVKFIMNTFEDSRIPDFVFKQFLLLMEEVYVEKWKKIKPEIIS